MNYILKALGILAFIVWVPTLYRVRFWFIYFLYFRESYKYFWNNLHCLVQFFWRDSWLIPDDMNSGNVLKSNNIDLDISLVIERMLIFLKSIYDISVKYLVKKWIELHQFIPTPFQIVFYILWALRDSCYYLKTINFYLFTNILGIWLLLQATEFWSFY